MPGSEQPAPKPEAVPREPAVPVTPNVGCMSAKGLNKNTHISGPEDAVAMTSKECQPKPEPNVEAPTSFWEAAAKDEPPSAKKIRCFKHEKS